jgi:hypothetical protein
MGGTHIGEKKDACTFLVGMPEGKRLLERPQSRWEDNIKMAVKEIGWNGMEWRHVSLYTDTCWGVVNKVMHFF